MGYEWTHRHRLRRVGDDDVDPGEVFTPTDAELRAFSGSIRGVDEPPDSDAEPVGETAEDDVTVVDPTEYSVTDLRDEVSLSELSDEERKDMVAVEQANKNRSSVVDWLEP